MPISFTTPAKDELEISLFGPGTGESIVAHLGNNQWMIVDSCKNPTSGQSASIEYLEKLGLNPSECVTVVVITHFHSDHVNGIDDVLFRCPKAKLFITAALLHQEAYTYIAAYCQDLDITDNSLPGTHAFKKVLSAIDAGKLVPAQASEGKVAFRTTFATVTCVSPSDAACLQATIDFAKKYTDLKGQKVRVIADKRLTENLCAVALHIESTVGTVLLGSDLESTGNITVGWDAVMASTVNPTTPAQLYKVAHHGSITGHHDDIVNQLLANNPTSILTTMNSSHLPTPPDEVRIAAYSNKAYCTTTPKQKPVKRPKQVESHLAHFTKKRTTLPKYLGHIQVRLSRDGINTEYNDYAKTL